MSLLVAGSVALDTLEGPFGRVSEELGGSALYFALAASLISPVALLAPVGTAQFETVRARLAGRPIDLSGLARLDAPTYRWQARQQAGRNLDLGSRDEIYDLWEPEAAPGWSGWAFVGSMRPDRQLAIAGRLRAQAELLAADAMLSYVTAAPRQAAELLEVCDWFFANEQELAALGASGGGPDAFRRAHGLKGLVLKRGPQGVSVYTDAGELRQPALPARVLDTTGAGDALAGAMLAAWREHGGSAEAVAACLRLGAAAAALAIEDIGLGGLAAASRERLLARATGEGGHD